MMEEHSAPLVSVIMPAYNAQEYIEAAIRSVMGQTYTNWQLLVIDDGSSDNTCQIVERLAQADSRVLLLRNESNQGVARTRNRGLEMAQGQYVALLDSDDIWHAKKLETQLETLNQTGADFCYCSYELINSQGQKVRADYLVPEKVSFDWLLQENVIGCSTVLLSPVITQTYRFETGFYHEDYVLWLQLLQDGRKAVGVTDVLADYRLVEGSRASNKLSAAKYRWDIYRKYLKLPVWKSLGHLTVYGIRGLRKYLRPPSGEE